MKPSTLRLLIIPSKNTCLRDNTGMEAHESNWNAVVISIRSVTKCMENMINFLS